MLEGEAGGGAAGRDADLAVDRGQVGVDGAWTDDKALGYLLIGQSLDHYAQHLYLAGCQSIRIRLLLLTLPGQR